MAKHNKKRNIGLLHEQLVRYASEMTVNQKSEKANEAVDLIVKHFNQNSELLREFKLFGALIYTNAKDREQARRIIEESKRLCKQHNADKLYREKTKLIHDINEKLQLEGFYDQRIPEYKLFATVQTLINEWRGDNRLDACETVDFEQKLEEHLLREVSKETMDKKEYANPLVLKLMIEKFNSKYGAALDANQKSLLEAKLSGNNDLLLERMNNLKTEVAKNIDLFFKDCNNATLLSKRKEVESMVESFVPSVCNDGMSKSLVMANLLREIKENER